MPQIQQHIDRFLAVFNDGSPVEEEIEYLGTYRVSGSLVTQRLDQRLQQAWSASVVPDFYQPLYDMKVGEPARAGGIFSAAPFAEYDPDDPQYTGLGLPASTETLFDFCTDNCGSPYWINRDLRVFARNIDNDIATVGSLEDFVRFAIDHALSGENWYTHISDRSATANYNLEPNEGFD